MEFEGMQERVEGQVRKKLPATIQNESLRLWNSWKDQEQEQGRKPLRSRFRKEVDEVDPYDVPNELAADLVADMKPYVEKAARRSLRAFGRDADVGEISNRVYFETIRHLRRHGPSHTRLHDLRKLKTQNVTTNEANRLIRQYSREIPETVEIDYVDPEASIRDREMREARISVDWLLKKAKPKDRRYIETWLVCEGNRVEIARAEKISYRQSAAHEEAVFQRIRSSSPVPQ